MAEIVKIPNSDDKAYKLETIADLIEVVTPENVETLKADVTDFLDYVIEVKNLQKSGDLIGNLYLKPFLLWKDDGKTGLDKIIVNIETEDRNV